MRIASLLLAALAALLLAGPAPAEPFEDHLDAFIAEVERLAAQIDPADPDLARRAKFLKKLQRTIKKKSISLATDAALAGKLGKLIAKAGDDLAELEDDIAAALADIGDRVEGLVGSMESRADSLPESDLKDRALGKLVKIRAILDGADPLDLAALGKAYKKALVKRRVVAKIVKKAEKQAGFGD